MVITGYLRTGQGSGKEGDTGDGGEPDNLSG